MQWGMHGGPLSLEEIQWHIYILPGGTCSFLCGELLFQRRKRVGQYLYCQLHQQGGMDSVPVAKHLLSEAYD